MDDSQSIDNPDSKPLIKYCGHPRAQVFTKFMPLQKIVMEKCLHIIRDSKRGLL